jgi:hypothetical protein
MAIKSVNGKNVYVIDVQVPTPRTSTGQSFGNLVSDLRWDLFDKIQKDIIRSGEIEKLGYQSEYEAYTDLKKSYQDQIANLNELKAKVMTGGSGSSEYLKTLRADAKNRLDYWKLSGGQAGKTETVTYPNKYEAISPFGTVKKLERGYTKTTTYGGGKAPPEGITVLDQGVEPGAQAGVAEQGVGIGKATDFIDAEIERLRQEQAGLVAPSYSGISDYTTAGRKAFAQTMGTGGFGLQNRPSKVQPTFYEAEATAALDKIQADYEQKELSNVFKKKSAQRTAIEARLQPYKDELVRLQNITEDLKTDEDRAKIERLDNIVSKANTAILEKFADPVTGKLKITKEDIALAKTNAADSMTSDFDLLGSRSVSRKGFLGYPEAPEISSENERARKERERKQRMPQNPPGTDREDPFFTGPRGVSAPEGVAKLTTSKPQEVIDIEGEGPYSASTDPFQRAGALPARSMLKTKYRQSEKVSEPTIPVEDFEMQDFGPDYFNMEEPLSKVDVAAEEMVAAQAAEEASARFGEADRASARAAAEREAEFRALLGEDYQQMPRPAGARSSFGRIEPSVRATMPIEQRGGEAVPFTRRPAGIADRSALERFYMDRSTAAAEPVEQPTTASGREELPEGGYIGSEEDIVIKRGGDLQSKVIPTRQSRSDLYLARTIKKGIELANKPAKVERLAKTSLPEKERAKVVPETVALVDKVYDINRGKLNAFKLSFDEVSRAFANKPEQRQQAHEYLVAKDMLEGNKVKPLA